MSLIKRAFDANEKRGADPTLNWGSSYIPTNGQSGLTAAGLSLTDDAALSISSVYTAVSILSDSVSTLPLRTYKTGDVSKTIQKPPVLIDNPWPEGTMQDWLAQVMFSLAMRGNFYGQIVDRDSRGYATMIRPLHPDQVTVRRVNGQRTYWFDGKKQNTDDVMHIPNILPPGGFIGINPVEYMRQSWALMLAAEKYGAGFFQNSALPQGVIEVGEDLSEEETIELGRAWKMGHQGLGNAGMPAVLTGGATFKVLSLKPEDTMFLATKSFQREEIAAFFRIPAHLMGQQDRTSSWGTGVEQMEIGFVINTLRPYLTKIESYLSRQLPPSIQTRFDLRGRLRGDQAQRFAGYTMAVNNGYMNLDEIRDLEDLAPLPNGQGQTFWRPLNEGPVEKILDGSLQPTGNGGQGGGQDQSPTAPAAGVVSK